MSSLLLLTVGIVRALCYQVSIVEAPIVGAAHHRRLFCFVRFVETSNDRAWGNAIGKTFAVVRFYNVVQWYMFPSNRCWTSHLYNFAGTLLPLLIQVCHLLA